MFKLPFRKGRGTRDQIVNIHWIIEKARECQKKTSTSALLTTPSLWLCMCGLQQTVEHSLRDGNTRPTDLSPGKSVCRSRRNSKNWTGKNRLVPKWERSTSRLYIVTLLTYMQSTSCEMPGSMKHKLESRLPGEISVTSDTQMTPSLQQKVKKNWRASWWKWKRREKKMA